MDTIEAILNRKSIRKFKDEPVKRSDLEEILTCGLNAPSAKNMQNWHFVVIEKEEEINAVATIVKEKLSKLATSAKDQTVAKSFLAKERFYTFFENAPVLILIYASAYASATSQLLSGEDLDKFRGASPGIQNIGAAIQNILLAASTLGYGTCWMTGPNFAIKEIEEYIPFKDDQFSLVAMTPLGIPTDEKHPSPKKKGIDEKVTFI